MRRYQRFLILSSSAALFLSSGCAELGMPQSGGGYPPYPRDSYYDSGTSYGGYRDDYYERERLRNENRRIERERDDLRRERDRIEEERERINDERRLREREEQRVPPPRVQERCPSGFTPSENKCSREERRRGCQDMRLPGGLGCVKR